MSDEKKPRRFKQARKEEPIEIEMTDGTIKTLIVRELMGDDRDDFLSYQAAKTKFNAEGNPVGMKDAKGIVTRLLSLALYDGDRRLSEQDVKELKLPNTASTELVEMISDMSALSKKAVDEAKNS